MIAELEWWLSECWCWSCRAITSAPSVGSSIQAAAPLQATSKSFRRTGLNPAGCAGVHVRLVQWEVGALASPARGGSGRVWAVFWRGGSVSGIELQARRFDLNINITTSTTPLPNTQHYTRAFKIDAIRETTRP